MDEQTDIYKTSRGMYVAEAAVEYFISMIVTGAYLAKVTTAIGISDGLTGILTSFVSLGCGFQIIAIFLANRRPVKRWVTALHSLNQLFFALIYLVPFMRVPQTVQIAIFVVFFLLGHVLNNVVNSPKINWFMSLVDDKRRGRFTALKESVSLIGGMLFSFGVGAAIDAYEAAGNLNGAFIFCGVGIFVLMLLHTGTLLLSKEKPAAEEEKIPVRKLLGELIRDKGLLKVIMISVLWNVAHYVTTPFYGTYQIGELGFTMTFVSLLSVLYAVVRTLFSRPLGKFADKRSFTQMMKICFIIAAAGFCVNAFTVPANGKVLYTIYYLLYAVGMAGINSGEINMIYDYIGQEKRVAALALKNTLAGVAGFFATALASLLVERIQADGNMFLGMNVYAQQVMSAIGCLLTLGVLLYVCLAFRKRKNPSGEVRETQAK